MGDNIIEKYGGLYPFLQTVVEKGKPIIDEFKPNPKFGEALFKTIKEKIKPIEINISGTLTLRSYNSSGVEDLKNILNKFIEQKVNVQYLGAPKYKLSVVSDDYKKAEGVLKKGLDAASSCAEKLRCEFNFNKNE